MAFTHLNEDNQPHMVDVADKLVTKRIAIARSIVILPKDVLDELKSKDLKTKKGPVFQTAILAGIMGCKKCSDLIPLCHPLPLSNCEVDIRINDNNEIEIDCTAKITGKTGVEMEALTGATIAALTIYDMCKAFSHDIVIKETKLMSKSGGKRNFERTK